MNKGFSLVEILVTIAIAGVLIAITINHMASTRDSKTMEGIAIGIVADLEEAKANAQTGKGGEQYGINFESGSYIIFTGSSFDPNDPDNQEIKIDSKFELSNTLGDLVVFSKIKGEPSSTGVIKVFLISDDTNYLEVNVGNLGDIGVLK